MGVGPDSKPVEVDPQSNTSRGRAAAAEAKRAGRSPPPTKGVSVLLGKLPPGCVARAFAQEVSCCTPVPHLLLLLLPYLALCLGMVTCVCNALLVRLHVQLQG